MTRIGTLLVGLALLAQPAAMQQVELLIEKQSVGPDDELGNPRATARTPDGSAWITGWSSDNVFHVATDGAVTEVFERWPGAGGCSGLALAADGTLYVANSDSRSVLRVSTGGELALVLPGPGAIPGSGLKRPFRMGLDAAGDLYVMASDSHNVLRVATDGTLTELVDASGAGPGQALDQPRDLVVAADGTVYVAGMGSDNVLRVDPSGAISQAIGPAGDGAGHPLDGAAALALGPDGSLYVASFFGNGVLRRDPGGAVTAVLTASGDGAGHALALPNALALAPDGTLYVAGFGSDNVFALPPGGPATQVLDLFGDGSGPLMNDPADLALSPDGTLYVASLVSETIHAFGTSGPQFVAEVPGYAPLGGLLVRRGHITCDDTGRLLVSLPSLDQVRRFEPGSGNTTLVDGWGGPGQEFDSPRAVAVDDQGRVFVAANAVFRFDDASGDFSIVAHAQSGVPESPLAGAVDVLFDHQGRLLVLGRTSDNLLRVEPDGTLTELLGPAGGSPGLELDAPADMVLGADGSVYIANTGEANVLAWRPDGDVELLLSWLDVYPGDSLSNAGWSAIAIDPLDRLYLAETKQFELHRLDPDGTLTLIQPNVGDEQPVSVAVEPGGAVLYGIRHPLGDGFVQRVEPSGASGQVLGSEGGGQGAEMGYPYGLVITGPGRVDVAGYSTHNAFAVDLGFCGGFTLLPGGVPASGGPLLTGEGSLCAGDGWLVQLSGGTPGAAATLVLGLSEFSVPFHGGTLVPFPDVLVPLPLDGTGAASLSGAWPTGLPTRISAWLQLWQPGFSASNALRLDLL